MWVVGEIDVGLLDASPLRRETSSKPLCMTSDLFASDIAAEDILFNVFPYQHVTVLEA